MYPLRAFIDRLKFPRVIWDREGNQPYLIRWYIFGDRKKGEWTGKIPVNLFVHKFEMSDDAGDLHSHPMAWSLSFVLYGGYFEEKRVGDKVILREIKPLRFNFIRHDDFHRVDLRKDCAWTLFLAGPHKSDWYFWNRDRKQRAHWLDYVKSRREGREPQWEDDRKEDLPPVNGVY